MKRFGLTPSESSDAPGMPTSATVESSDAHGAPTPAPAEPSDAHGMPTAAPVEPSNVPGKPISAPAKSSDAPSMPTSASAEPSDAHGMSISVPAPGRFGLIGHPVAGSLSPRLFEAAYGGQYAYDLLEGADFGASWQRFLDDYAGINITAPFKQDAFHAVDALSDDARLCGAVNLAVKTPAGIVGYNTDVAGVILAVREACGGAVPGRPASGALAGGEPALGQSAGLASPDTQPVIPGSTGNLLKQALVVGCGGAGRAAAVAALRLGYRVTLANRTPSRAADLAADLNASLTPDLASDPNVSLNVNLNANSAADLNASLNADINAHPAANPASDLNANPAVDLKADLAADLNTSLPLAGTPANGPSGAAESRTACTWVPAEAIGTLSPDLVIYTVPGPMDGFPDFQDAVILEANYRTPCLQGRGRTYISGLRWLLYQAVAGYEIFTGETPDADAMFRIFC